MIKENYYGLSTRYSVIFPYYTTAEVFRKDLSEDYLMSYSFDVRDDREESDSTIRQELFGKDRAYDETTSQN